MRTSLKGQYFIAAREALVTVPYPDGTPKNGVQRWSIGFGSPSTENGSPITIEQAWASFPEKLAPYEGDVLHGLAGAPVTQQMFDALVSFDWNEGAKDKAILYLALCVGDVIKASEILRSFDKRDGVVSKGHAIRREAEQKLFLRGDYGNLSTYPLFEGQPRGPNKVLPRFVPFPTSEVN